MSSSDESKTTTPSLPAEFKLLPVQFLKTHSMVWSQESFLAAVNAPRQPEKFVQIALRRQRLKQLKPRPLHSSYDNQELSHHETRITAAAISLPPRYGTLLYALACAFGARRALEAGSGYGVSSMYLAVALAETGCEDSRLISFELATYAAQAQKSLDLITGGNRERGLVVHDDFNALGRYLPAKENFDLAFIDSRHDDDMLIRSFKSAQGWMGSRSMILIDDVNYSETSRFAWQELSSQKNYPFAALVNERIGVLSA